MYAGSLWSREPARTLGLGPVFPLSVEGGSEQGASCPSPGSPAWGILWVGQGQHILGCGLSQGPALAAPGQARGITACVCRPTTADAVIGAWEVLGAIPRGSLYYLVLPRSPEVCVVLSSALHVRGTGTEVKWLAQGHCQ